MRIVIEILKRTIVVCGYGRKGYVEFVDVEEILEANISRTDRGRVRLPNRAHDVTAYRDMSWAVTRESRRGKASTY
jgi:hypothetical protein